MSQSAPRSDTSYDDAFPPLSPRDLELLRHLRAGKSTAQLAAALVVSRNTVRTRLRRLQGKLGAHDREQVVGRTRQLELL